MTMQTGKLSEGQVGLGLILWVFGESSGGRRDIVRERERVKRRGTRDMGAVTISHNQLQFIEGETHERWRRRVG